MKELRFTIPLAPVTKKNSQRIANCGRYSKILPSKAYVQYEKDAGYFLPNRGKKHTQPCEVVCLFYMPTKRRVDLTNLLEGHVALYIGDGQIVHASSPGVGIIVSGANYRSILAIRRIF